MRLMTTRSTRLSSSSWHEHAREQPPSSADQADRAFRRIVWAPRILDAGGPAAAVVTNRDPVEVLERFDTQIQTDQIDGDILGRFLEFLFQHLAEATPRPVVKASTKGTLEIFLAYHAADEDYALQIAEALRNGPVKIRIPVSSGNDPDARRFNRDLLAKCDAVAVCWANASEVWVRSEADRLSEWQALGRKQRFAYRSLIVGPPPTPRKRVKALSLLFADGEFDKIIDVAEKEGPPTRELLAELASAHVGSGS